MKKIILCSIILCLLIACADKVVKYAVIGETMNPQELPSTVTYNETYLIADTIIVSVSGKILGSYIHERTDTISDALSYANVVLTNLKTKEVYEKFTEEDGTYRLTISAGNYQLKVQHVGYTPIFIENLQFGTGEVFNFLANLGQGFTSETFTANNKKNRRTIVRNASD